MFSKLIYRFKVKFFPSLRYREHRRFVMDGGDNCLRFTYNLSPSSLVFDVGGYTGQFTSDLYSKYCCKVIIFEPVHDFAVAIADRFRFNPDIQICTEALSGHTGSASMALAGDGSSLHFSEARDSVSTNKSSARQEISLIDVHEYIKTHNISCIDLIKINIEGGEYDLLDRMIETGDIHLCRAIQVQFHDFFHDAGLRRDKIRSYLSRYFTCQYNYEWTWESWIAKE